MTHKTYARITALVAAGFLVTSGGAAFADTTTSGNGSLGGGNQIDADVDAPVNLCGNAVAVLGIAGAQCEDSGAASSSTQAPSPQPEEEEDKEDDRTDPPGYEEDEDPGDGSEEPEHDSGDEKTPAPTQPPEDSEGGHDPGGDAIPEDESEQDVPGTDPSEQQVDREAGGTVPSTASPAPADPELAVTGTDATGLAWLVAAAATAIAAGAALVVGLRRRSHS